MTLRNQLIKLAYQNPGLRGELLPLINKLASDKIPFEPDEKAFPAEAYRVQGQHKRVWGDTAWWVLGWELDIDEATGASRRSGRVVAVKAGDDTDRHTFDPDELAPVSRYEYCEECRQVGSSHSHVVAPNDHTRHA